tara:strand:+ start:80255 stop:80953 length:699 start_codon:yes stop_codon:yes gene_type:complete
LTYIHIITIFPEFFNEFITTSIVGIAREKKLVTINIINLRDFADDNHKSVDSPPYGGGPGMILKAIPLIKAVNSVRSYHSESKDKIKVVLTSPKGKVLNQKKSRELSNEKILVIVCGHYGGVDQRFIDRECDEEISIGDYILTGGEIPAMVISDSLIRLLPGTLGNPDSNLYDSFSEYNSGMLEAPLYTRPEIIGDNKVPEILLSGNHSEIEKWRLSKSLDITKSNRPDLKI